MRNINQGFRNLGQDDAVTLRLKSLTDKICTNKNMQSRACGRSLWWRDRARKQVIPGQMNKTNRQAPFISHNTRTSQTEETKQWGQWGIEFVPEELYLTSCAGQ